MKNKFITLVMLLLTTVIFAGNCCNKPCTDAKVLLKTPENFIDKAVSLVGTVDHVCRNSGKKLSLSFEGSETIVKAMASKKIAKFDAKVNGKQVKVTGIFRKIDLPKDEKEEHKEEEEHGTGEHSSGFTTENKDGSKNMYYIECESYELVN